MSISDVIDDIPKECPDHELPRMRQGIYSKGLKPPWIAEVPLQVTILTRRCGYHSSATKAFTTREVACLLSFPLEHLFSGLGSEKETDWKCSPAVCGQTDLGGD